MFESCLSSTHKNGKDPKNTQKEKKLIEEKKISKTEDIPDKEQESTENDEKHDSESSDAIVEKDINMEPVDLDSDPDQNNQADEMITSEVNESVDSSNKSEETTTVVLEINPIGTPTQKGYLK